MENTNNRAIMSMINKGIKGDVKKVLYEQLHGESDLAAAEDDTRKMCWEFQGQEDLVDCLYNLQMSFPTDY